MRIAFHLVWLMIFYIIKRVLQAALVMLLVAFVSFTLFNYVGDPVNNMVGQEATIKDRDALRVLSPRGRWT